MIIETKIKLKLTSTELCVLQDCQELLTKIAVQADELGGEFDEIQSVDIDNAIDTLITLKDISDEYYGV